MQTRVCSWIRNQESGTGLTETSEMEEGQDLDYWDEQESQIKNYDKPMDDNHEINDHEGGQT